MGAPDPAALSRGRPRPAARAEPEARHRAALVAQLRLQGIRDEAVLAAIGGVPRHRFVNAAVSRRAERAYANKALPIGYRQTISQPYVVAYMTQELLRPAPPRRVLEIGTGSGYQCAVLARLVPRVYSVERIPQLHRQASRLLRELGCRNVSTRLGDGSRGWPAGAPYDAILVTAAAAEYPAALGAQLAPGGRLLVPEGPAAGAQTLVRYTRAADGMTREPLLDVQFVPLVPEGRE